MSSTIKEVVVEHSNGQELYLINWGQGDYKYDIRRRYYAGWISDDYEPVGGAETIDDALTLIRSDMYRHGEIEKINIINRS